ncbi:MAG: alpha/beta fold hydrolase [Candidatus Dormibacteraceae bacterium]
MPRAVANGIELEYETFGDPGDQPLVLIAGLAAQMISWQESFCELLASRGFFVIRFDNRDCGLSMWMESAGPPDLGAAFRGEGHPAYQLEDMAGDVAGLLDALGIPDAHLVGASMGGFIAQLVAINHRERVLSLTSIMSGPGGSDEVAPQPEGAAILMALPPATREERIEQAMTTHRTLAGSGDQLDDAVERSRAERSVDRAYHPLGVGRQLVAILAAESRLQRLKHLRVPALVVHGTDDVLVPLANGRLVAGAVPRARFIEVKGMGHDLPERVWSELADAIEELARRSAPARRQ